MEDRLTTLLEHPVDPRAFRLNSTPRKMPAPRVSKLPRDHTEFEKYYKIQDWPRQESLLKQLERGQSATDFMSIVLMRSWSIPESSIERESMNILDGSLGDLKRLLRVSRVCWFPGTTYLPLYKFHSFSS